MKALMKALYGAAALAAFAATPTYAATALEGISECTSGASCISGTTNVNLGAFTNSDIVSGTIGMSGGGNATVYFDSNQGNLSTNPGAATVFLADNSLLTNLTFYLLNGQGFSQAEFNLENGDPSAFTVTMTDSAGQNYDAALTKLQGSNVFDIVAPAGVLITSVTINTVGGGFADLKQLRLNGVGMTAAVPEPATWAMMLFGFGGIGFSMRRKARRANTLMQVA